MSKSEKKVNIINFINSVIEKKFSTSSKGYDPREVDLTLDSIFDNVSKFIDELELIKQKNIDLINENDSLKKELIKLNEDNEKLKYDLKRLEESGIYSNMLMNIIHKEKNYDETKSFNHDEANTKKSKI